MNPIRVDEASVPARVRESHNLTYRREVLQEGSLISSKLVRSPNLDGVPCG